MSQQFLPLIKLEKLKSNQKHFVILIFKLTRSDEI